MKLHVTRAAGQNLFTGYGDDYVAINNQRFEHSVVVSPARAVIRWDPSRFEHLKPAHFEAILEFTPEIVIFGSGGGLRFPAPDLTRSLSAAAIGFEVMDTKAACRTYNILLSEGREVVAAVLI